MIVDNDYLVASQHDLLCPPVDVYRGKHAVKSQVFFDVIRAQQAVRMPQDWVYKPLKFEVEITDGCNQGCPHCGMSARPANDGKGLQREVLLSIPNQLHALGIPGISITGGEPFTVMPVLLELLSECRGKVDVVKLTTNAYWADTLESGLSHLRLLANQGLSESRLFRPVLMLSIGEQSVPLQSIVNAIIATRTVFDSRELALCISSLSFRSGVDRLSELEQSYQKTVGEDFPWDSIFLTKRNYIAAGKALFDENLPRRSIPIRKMCKERGCFRQTVGAVVVPTPLIKTDGSVFTCSVFGMPSEFLLGSIQNMTIKEILTAANCNIYVRILANGGLPALMQQLPDHMIDGIVVDNFHEACWRLIGMMAEIGDVANIDNLMSDGVLKNDCTANRSTCQAG